MWTDRLSVHQQLQSQLDPTLRLTYLWSTSIIETVLNLPIDLWTEHNAEVHGQTYVEQNAALLKKPQAEITRPQAL